MNVGSLFSGIGGFDLGFERAGMRTAWLCEQDAYCQRVLAKHWPGVPCYPDITNLRGADLEPVDVLCGGFPCQDLSYAGKGAGIDGARSGLWAEYARLIGELRPRYVVVENVPALLARGMGRVLGDLAALGYDAEWDCLPASAVGAPHRRDRVWVVAYPAEAVADPGGERRERRPGEQGTGGEASERSEARGDARHSGGSRDVADAEGEPVRPGLRADEPGGLRGGRPGDGGSAFRVADAGSARLQGPGGEHGLRTGSPERAESPDGGWWGVEPAVGRVAHGVPARVDRLRALGNALVPQIAEWIGRRILEREAG